MRGRSQRMSALHAVLTPRALHDRHRSFVLRILTQNLFHPVEESLSADIEHVSFGCITFPLCTSVRRPVAVVVVSRCRRCCVSPPLCASLPWSFVCPVVAVVVALLLCCCVVIAPPPARHDFAFGRGLKIFFLTGRPHGAANSSDLFCVHFYLC